MKKESFFKTSVSFIWGFSVWTIQPILLIGASYTRFTWSWCQGYLLLGIGDGVLLTSHTIAHIVVLCHLSHLIIVDVCIAVAHVGPPLARHIGSYCSGIYLSSFVLQAFRLALNSTILFVFDDRRVGLCITLFNHDLFILHDILAVSGHLQLL